MRNTFVHYNLQHMMFVSARMGRFFGSSLKKSECHEAHLPTKTVLSYEMRIVCIPTAQENIRILYIYDIRSSFHPSRNASSTSPRLSCFASGSPRPRTWWMYQDTFPYPQLRMPQLFCSALHPIHGSTLFHSTQFVLATFSHPYRMPANNAEANGGRHCQC